MIAIHGELCGGYYPHNNVTPINGLSPIQSGIYYSPNLQFIAFDIAIYKSNSTDSVSYLTFYEASTCAVASNFIFIKPLKLCTREEALDYSPTFLSTIPAYFKLPTLRDNYAEGIVIRSLYTHNLIKIKNEKFAELVDEIEFHGQDIGPFIAMATNPNRIQSSISKIGKLSMLNANQIVNDVVDDCFVDLSSNSNTLHYATSLNAMQVSAIRDHLRMELSKYL
jgi:hypothetical protein